MSEIYVASSSAMQELIDNLTNLNSNFRTKKDEIQNEQNTLTTKWEGDSSTTFQERYQKEAPAFEEFAATIDQYINALKEALAEYEATEAKNQSIAQGS